MELNEVIKLGNLLDAYGELLTPKMKEILSMYVCENMSYQEIATYFNISKPAVLDAIRSSQKKLLNYEGKIKFLQFKQELQNCLNEKDLKQKLQNLLKEY